MAPRGICPKCGVEVYGWCLSLPRHQTCTTCGVGYIITEPGQFVARGYSPFQAPEARGAKSRVDPNLPLKINESP